MRKDKKKTSKKIASAAAMLLLSTAMLGTATYAWFTMNKEVSVTNMQVKAKAEGGLLINEVADPDDTGWDNEATADNLPTGVALIPTSTKDGTKWWHANSKTANDEAGAGDDSLSTSISGDYVNITSNLTAKKTDAVETPANALVGGVAENNIYYIERGSNTTFDADTDDAYYVMYKYYMKVSSDSAVTLGQTAGDQNVAIKEVKATIPASGTGSATSADLDKSLRVGVKIGGKMYIYAPVYSAKNEIAAYYVTDTYTAASGNTAASITNTEVNAFYKTDKINTALGSLPAVTTTTPVEVDVYIWFEGEDDFCQSDNITDTLDDIKIDITFELESIGTPSTNTNNEF